MKIYVLVGEHHVPYEGTDHNVLYVGTSEEKAKQIRDDYFDELTLEVWVNGVKVKEYAQDSEGEWGCSIR